MSSSDLREWVVTHGGTGVVSADDARRVQVTAFLLEAQALLREISLTEGQAKAALRELFKHVYPVRFASRVSVFDRLCGGGVCVALGLPPDAWSVIAFAPPVKSRRKSVRIHLAPDLGETE